MALVVDELAGVAQHGGGGQPAFVLGRQLVQRLQLAVKLHGVGAHRLGVPQIDPIAPRRGQHALPALVLELPVGGGAGILLGQHLGQNAVAQPQRRVAEAGQPEALQQFGEDLRAGHDNLRPPRPDALDRRALGSVIRASLAASLRTSRVGDPGQRGKAGALESSLKALPAVLLADFLAGDFCPAACRFAALAGGPPQSPRSARRPCPRWR
jgi:hypothetical protein